MGLFDKLFGKKKETKIQDIDANFIKEDLSTMIKILFN